MSITLAELKEQARFRADQTNSNFIEDAELTTYINSSIAELQDLLISSYGNDYYVSTNLFSTVANVDTYALPADFYKLLGVDAKISGNDWFSLSPFNFNERNRNDLSSAWGMMVSPAVRYRMVGNNLVFSPFPEGVFPIRVWYVPLAVKLVADTDVLADLNQYAEYVIVDAAIKMMQKEESDVSVLAAQKGALVKRIAEMAQNRDAGSPESVSDIYAANNDYYFYRGS